MSFGKEWIEPPKTVRDMPAGWSFVGTKAASVPAPEEEEADELSVLEMAGVERIARLIVAGLALGIVLALWRGYVLMTTVGGCR